MNDPPMWKESGLDKLNPYGWVQFLNRKLYEKVLERTESPVEVWVVGSIHTGGVGKTPFVMSLIDRVSKKYDRIGVLTRGVGGQSVGTPLWVCDGQGPIVDVPFCGDEAWLLAQNFPQTFLVCSPSRIQGIQMLMRRHVQLIICDDGFQHLALKPHKTFVLLPSQPDRRDVLLAPRGRLRERLRWLKEADEVWVESAWHDRWQKILQVNGIELNQLHVYKRNWVGALHEGQVKSLQEMVKEFGKKPAKIILSIGRPNHFVENWKTQIGTPYQLQVYPDHAPIPVQDLKDSTGPLVMTEKEWVKVQSTWAKHQLPHPDRCWVLLEDIQLGGVSL